MDEHAPIALFAYNRLDVLRVTVDALMANEGADTTPLWIFVDGPKNESAAEKVDQVRYYLQDLKWPGPLELRCSEVNRGLANSIRAGVTEVLERHGRVIVVEDDIETHPGFLASMNAGLDAYRKVDRVHVLNGMGLPKRFLEFPPGYDEAVYFSYRPTSHGWATWQDRWENAIWEDGQILELLRNPAIEKRFRRMGADTIGMLNNTLAAKVDSWAIKWAFSIAVQNGVCVTPVDALTTHQPSDEGTHVKGSHEWIEHDLGEAKAIVDFPATIQVHDEVAKSFAARYGEIREEDFEDTMNLRELSQEELGGGITLMDIGASGSLNEKWKVIEPLISLVAFDPNEEECKRLTREGSGSFANALYLPYAIAGQSGEAKLFQTKSIYCWSLLEPDSEWLSRFSFSDLFEVEGSSQLQVKALEDVEELQGISFDAVKMDVQGMELPILKASGSVFDEVFYLETETGFTANYQGETRFFEVSQYLQDRGFLMFDINPNHRVARQGPFAGSKETRGQPLWCEAVWLRDVKSPKNSSFLDGVDRKKGLRMLLLCATEGFWDYGYEVACVLRERGLLTDAELESLSRRDAWILSSGGAARMRSQAVSGGAARVEQRIKSTVARGVRKVARTLRGEG